MTFNCMQNDNHRNNVKHTIPYYRNIMLAEMIFLSVDISISLDVKSMSSVQSISYRKNA